MQYKVTYWRTREKSKPEHEYAYPVEASSPEQALQWLLRLFYGERLPTDSPRAISDINAEVVEEGGSNRTMFKKYQW